MIELIFNTLSDAHVKISVVVVVSRAAPTVLPYIEVALSILGAAMV